MPYKNTKELPDAVKKLPEKAQRAFMHAFNSAHDSGKDEETSFKIAWSAAGNVKKDSVRPLVKAGPDADAQQIIYCVVLEPDTEDLQGDVISAQEIEKVAHEYAIESRVVGDSHSTVADASVVETFIAPADFPAGDGSVIKKGSWVMAIKIHDKSLWYAVQAGEYDGLSIGGFGERIPQ